jgi:hypothetical protein
MLRRTLAFSVVLTFTACGGSSKPADAPQGEEPPDESWDDEAEEDQGDEEGASDDEAAPAEPEAVIDGIPSECEGKGEVCTPPSRWVSKLCADVYSDVALYMFQSGTPWQRMYLTRETDAINASGGASVAGKLAFDEEVLVLRHRPVKKDGIQVGSASGSYDAMRWDGSCVSLEGEELTTNVPPKPKTTRVEWKWIGGDMRDALREDETVNKTYIARRKECKGVSMGAVSKKCEKLDKQLIDVIVDYVRSTSSLPEPKAQP